MKNTAKRILTVLTAAALAVGMMFAAPMPYTAQAAVKNEGGSTFRTAVQVNLGQDVDFTCDENSNAHYYTFTTSGRTDSTYTIRLQYLGGNSEHTSSLAIRDENGRMVTHTNLRPVNGMNSADVTLTANTRYYLVGYISGNAGSWIEKLNRGETENLSFRITENIAKPLTPQITKAKASGKKAVKLSWTRSSAASQYRVRYRLTSSSKWKYKVVTSSSLKLSGLKKKKKYKIQVRGERIVDGKSYNSEWSPAVTVKTKK